MRFDGLMDEIDALTGKAEHAWAAFQAQQVRTCLLVLPRELCAVEVRGGKSLARFSAPLLDRNEETEITAAFAALKKQGLRGKSLLLLANFPSLRIGVKRFPDMTAEEFEETLYWEQDRIFSGGDTLTLACHVLSHTPEGYVAFLHAVPQDVLERWQRAAEAAGFSLSAAVPVTDISFAAEPCFLLYERTWSAILVYRSPARVETRVVKLSARGKAALFFRHILGGRDEPRVPLYLVPLADAGEEKRRAWRSWIEGEIAAYAAGDAVEDVTGEEETGGLYAEEEDIPAEDPPGGPEVYLATPAEDGAHPLWDTVLRLALTSSTAEAVFSFTPPESQEDKEERRPLRLAQGAAVLAGLFLLTGAGTYLSAWNDFRQVEKRAASLAPEQAAFEERQAARQERRRQKDLLEKLDRRDPRWEQKLVFLSDQMPEGVVLKSLQADPRSGTVRLTGTTRDGEALESFRTALRQNWGGLARIESGENKGRYAEFTLEWKPEEPDR